MGEEKYNKKQLVVKKSLEEILNSPISLAEVSTREREQYRSFKKVVDNYITYTSMCDNLYDIGIDISSSLEFYFIEMVKQTLTLTFNKAQQSIVKWYLFSKLGDEPESVLTDIDDPEKIIPCETVDDIWELVKKYK